MGTSATQLSSIASRRREQRASARKRISQSVAIEILPGEKMWLLDLGEGGVRLSGTTRLELGITASIHFQVPGTNSVFDATGVVAWSDVSGSAGVRFTRIEPDSIAALRRWLKSGATMTISNSTEASQPDAELTGKVSSLAEVTDLQAEISSGNLDSAQALELIVRRMAELTRATGAAIALREGEDVVCRAKFGNAPDAGVKLSPSSLSGGCFRTGTIVLLEDSENDSRVSPEVCRQLNFRSLLVLPITSGTEVVGIAEVLSANSHNFEGGDILVLSFLADMAASVFMPGDESSGESPLPEIEAQLEPMVTIAHVPLPTEPLSPAPAPRPAPVLVSSKALTSAMPAAATASAPALVVTPTTPAPRFGAHLPATKRQSEFLRRQPRLAALVIAALILLAAAAFYFGYYIRRHRGLEQSLPAPAAVTSSPVTSDKSSVAAAGAEIPSHTPSPPAIKTTQSAAPRSAAAPPATHQKTSAAVELEVVQGTRSQVTEPDSAPEAPAIGQLAAPRSSVVLPSIVAANTPAPGFQAVRSQGVVEGKLLKRVLPKYPEMARRAGIAGDVVLAAIITIDGKLRDLKVVSGSPLLREEAISAAKQWRYSPYQLGGKPIETETRITISFHR